MKELKKRLRETDYTIERYDYVRCESISSYQCEQQCSPIYEAYAYGYIRGNRYNEIVDL